MIDSKSCFIICAFNFPGLMFVLGCFPGSETKDKVIVEKLPLNLSTAKWRYI